MGKSIHEMAEEMIKSAQSHPESAASPATTVNLEKAAEFAQSLRALADTPDGQVKQAGAQPSLREKLASYAKPMTPEDKQTAQLLLRLNGLSKSAADLEKEAAKKQCKECKKFPCKCPPKKGNPFGKAAPGKDSKLKAKMLEFGKKKEGK